MKNAMNAINAMNAMNAMNEECRKCRMGDDDREACSLQRAWLLLPRKV
jgi:hypothetical protein